MKSITLLSADEKELYFVPENRILEASQNDDKTTTLAVVDIITVKSTVKEIRQELSSKYIKKIYWHI